MLSRISKDKNNNVKHHFELAASASEEPRDRRRKSSTPGVFSRRSSTPSVFSRKSSTDTESSTYDDDSKEIEALFYTLIDHNNAIVDLYDKEFANKTWGLSKDACKALIHTFNTLETKYNASKENLLKKKLSSAQQNEIKEMDTDISAIREEFLTYCETTKVENKEIETKLDELDNIIKEGNPIIEKNYGNWYTKRFAMTDANCREMRDWCDKTIPDFRKKLEDLRGRVTDNGSLPYKTKLTKHENYLKDLETKYNDVIKNKCVGKL